MKCWCELHFEYSNGLSEKIDIVFRSLISCNSQHWSTPNRILFSESSVFERDLWLFSSTGWNSSWPKRAFGNSASVKQIQVLSYLIETFLMLPGSGAQSQYTLFDIVTLLAYKDKMWQCPKYQGLQISFSMIERGRKRKIITKKEEEGWNEAK